MRIIDDVPPMRGTQIGSCQPYSEISLYSAFGENAYFSKFNEYNMPELFVVRDSDTHTVYCIQNLVSIPLIYNEISQHAFMIARDKAISSHCIRRLQNFGDAGILKRIFSIKKMAAMFNTSTHTEYCAKNVYEQLLVPLAEYHAKELHEIFEHQFPNTIELYDRRKFRALKKPSKYTYNRYTDHDEVPTLSIE